MGGGITWLNLARLTKYSGLALIAVSVLAVIVLNVIISCSNSKIQAGAESPVTLATNVTDEASISLSIHSATDSCDTSTSANPAADVCLQIPDATPATQSQWKAAVIPQTCRPQTLVLALAVIMN